jgi:4-alpha-glucanotransferase
VRELAHALGIAGQYTDCNGNTCTVPDETLRTNLNIFGIAGESDEALQQSYSVFLDEQWESWLPPVVVVADSELPARITLTLPQALAGLSFKWQLFLEGSSEAEHQGILAPPQLRPIEERTIAGQLRYRFEFILEQPVSWGYHRLVIHPVDESARSASCAFIVTPSQCYLPPGVDHTAESKRFWGPAVQLYALRSQNNWGIGDFGDLKKLLTWGVSQGMDVLGLNPLHALSLINPHEASPYSPSSRLTQNMLYLNIEAIEDYKASVKAQALVLSETFQDRLNALREADFVNYPGVMATKREVLELIYEHFIEHHIKFNSESARSFFDFVDQAGQSLQNFTLYEALQEHFYQQDCTLWGWPVWPEAYRRHDTDAVLTFAARYQNRIQFFQYLQWQLHLQLQDIHQLTQSQHMGVGLYMDMAVGASGGGAEIWFNQDLYAFTSSVGCPPDTFCPEGQNWGLPPLIPNKVREKSYQPFIETFQKVMQYAGAIRIDHFMGLMRLFWVPPGGSAALGGYVYYPFEDILRIMALESHRNQTMIIGEDLGTVPDGLRDTMLAWNILSYKVFYFEKYADQEYMRAEDLPQAALVTLSTQDLPTVKGYWEGAMPRAKAAMGKLPEGKSVEDEMQWIYLERGRIIRLLQGEGLLPEGPWDSPVMTEPLNLAIHQHLAQTPCWLQMFQLEDAFEQTEQVNIPGTTTEYPNWQRKLPQNLEYYASDARLLSLLKVLACRSVSR